jgi:hypothetical protein
MCTRRTTGNRYVVVQLTLMPQVAQAIVKCSITLASSPNWRLQEDFVRQLACLTTVYTSNEIHMKFIQHMFHLLHTLVTIIINIIQQ